MLLLFKFWVKFQTAHEIEGNLYVIVRSSELGMMQIGKDNIKVIS